MTIIFVNLGCYCVHSQLKFFMLQFQNLFGSNSLDGGSSPMVKPKGDKQVEYLDLDLDSGKSTPPRKVSTS